MPTEPFDISGAIIATNRLPVNGGKPPSPPTLDSTVRNLHKRVSSLETAHNQTSKDVATSKVTGTPKKGDIATWDGTQWVPQGPPWVALASAPSELGQVITWNGNGWVPASPDEDQADTSDLNYLVLDSSPFVDGQIPTWDDTNQVWEPRSPRQGTIPSVQHPGDYTFAAGDEGQVHEGTNDTGQVFTIPKDVLTPLCVIEVFQFGDGQISIQAEDGVTLRSDGDYYMTAALYATIGIRNRAPNDYVLSGDLGSAAAH